MMKVVLKHAGEWLCFSKPERVLRADRIDQVMPMIHEAEASGLFAAGFIAYEAAAAFDAALKTHAGDVFPLLCFGLFRAPEVLEDIEHTPGARYEIGSLTPSISRKEYVASIARIKTQIAEGATYQVNYTYRLNADFNGDAWAFFHALVKDQKAEHAAFVEVDGYAICSASPELFFSLRDGTIVSRPMKGTAQRGRTNDEDRQQAEALRHSEKDRSENIMIVDMIRNDIGRVAKPGSIKTVSVFDIEKYPTVWQMTSTVSGETAEPVSAVLKALFPCASITGAPKSKTMELIHGLEDRPRKIYTGSVGFLSPRGEASFSVAIRTALIDQKKGTLEYGVGGGIVWDSDAASEYEETLIKARVLTRPRPDFKLLETLLWEPASGIFLLDGHFRRLGNSAAYFDIPLDAPAIRRALEQALQDIERAPHKVRMLISRNGEFEIQCALLGSQPDERIDVALAKKPVDSLDVFLFHKTTHRSVYETARADFPDFADVILWNEHGEVTESCIANVVIRKEGKLITPPVECGLLAGVFRQHLLNNDEIEEGVVLIEDLWTADDVFLVNSVRKWQKCTLPSSDQGARHPHSYRR
jgi:para-aminobenzoate synthetase/4-amino-4-deoxychorismate lyase